MEDPDEDTRSDELVIAQTVLELSGSICGSLYAGNNKFYRCNLSEDHEGQCYSRVIGLEPYQWWGKNKVPFKTHDFMKVDGEPAHVPQAADIRRRVATNRKNRW